MAEHQKFTLGEHDTRDHAGIPVGASVVESQAGSQSKVDTHDGVASPHSVSTNLVKLAGQLGGTAASPDVRGLRETGTPTLLTMGAVGDGMALTRAGATIVGGAVAGLTHQQVMSRAFLGC